MTKPPTKVSAHDLNEPSMFIELDRLHAHPHNANIMNDVLLSKLRAHIEQSGNYPPLIVREHPRIADAYELLDGHHRAAVLRELGYDRAQCMVWTISDEQADMMLLTLNRLHGSDDPVLRGRLLAKVAASMSMDAAASMLPDARRQIDRLIAATRPAAAIAPTPRVDDMPHALTFFLSSRDRARIIERLGAINAEDRNAALLQLIDMA